MGKFLSFYSIAILLVLASCNREIEESAVDLGFDYQPLELGNYWIYDVELTTYFGENDSEEEFLFYRDRIRSFYVNAEGEQVFIVERSSSTTQENWNFLIDYTLVRRGFTLIRTMENQPLVTFVFPPEVGRTWDGNIYRSELKDEFTIDEKLPESAGQFSGGRTFRVLQEESDDRITFRDIRYEFYTKGVGMTESYAEVLTYCSRNDCLGDELIDSGYKLQMRLKSYGKG